MPDTVISSVGSTSALPDQERRVLLAYYQKHVDRADAPWSAHRDHLPYLKLTPAQEATMLRALLTYRVQGKAHATPTQVFLSHENLSAFSLGRIVRKGNLLQGNKILTPLLSQKNLTDVDRLIGLVRYQSSSYQSWLNSHEALDRDELDLTRNISDHWGQCSLPLPDKIAQQIVDLDSGRKEIFVALLTEASDDLWDLDLRHKRLGELLRTAQNI